MLHLTTLDLNELSVRADAWDDLWRRSGVRLPSNRANGIELWCQTFAGENEFQALVVHDDQRFVAALPLVKDTSVRFVTVYRLPTNCTVGAGDLLIDPKCDVDAATKLIVDHVTRLPGCLAAFEGVQIDSPRWQRMIDSFERSGRESHQSDGHDVGIVDILHDWDAYTRSWSRNHRSAIKRCRKKLEAQGTVEVQRLREPSDDELHQVLEACYVIEDKGWKGDNGTSILKSPGLAEYYHQEARIMRDGGMLDLWLLKLDDQIIAFEYCHYSKATCFSHKISFDPAFDRFSPGRVLRCIQLEQYHQDPAAEMLDTLGVLCEAKAKWITRSYRSSRCYVAIGGPYSNWLMRGFKFARRLAKSMRRTNAVSEPIRPGAAKYLETANASTRRDADIAPLVMTTDEPLVPTPSQHARS
ncbi:MAG: GNAT family N-acetyltransferase [Pirellulaceae bacterium]|nr:GNAT family N-acetyltransferase [Pirellulaceae bacterium]